MGERLIDVVHDFVLLQREREGEKEREGRREREGERERLTGAMHDFVLL